MKGLPRESARGRVMVRSGALSLNVSSRESSVLERRCVFVGARADESVREGCGTECEFIRVSVYDRSVQEVDEEQSANRAAAACAPLCI